MRNAGHHAAAAHPLDSIGGIPVSLLVEIALVAAGLLLLGLIVIDAAHVIRARRRRNQRLLDRAEAEARNRALMSELCPHGWKAEITLHDDPDEPPDGRRDGQTGAVRLEWSELDAGTGAPIRVRRVWAPTVSQALEAMVTDRRTEQTLEQIERGAAADGVLWPDVS